jgi:thioredoxin 1
MEDFMKFKFILMAVLLIFISTFSEGCSNDHQNASAVNSSKKVEHVKSAKNDNKKLFTFIDLGSVKCIACKMMEPVIEKLREHFKGKVNVVFYDVWTEEGRPYAHLYKRKLIPIQIILDKNGNEVFRHEGFITYEDVVAKLKTLGVN